MQFQSNPVEMSATQEKETITSAQDAEGQPNAATAGGKSESQPIQNGPPPPAYQPPVATNLHNTQQPSTTPAGDTTATQQGGATTKQPQQLVTPLQALTEKPAWIDCPFCKQRTQTRSTRLACLPCVAGWCENVHIYCSKCGKEVAMIPHDGMIQVAPVPPEHGPTPSRYAS
ncbi:hypothetical protein RRF57_011553 [Xylaria bambusicola]|uniref:LITAF domain-containing protein n=1 Tax=Xylaria bambusicola TaxID=326684 RepID=A0AAN7ZD86_9PEZI